MINSNLLKGFGIFTVGVAIGALGMRMIIKKKYEDLVEEEIASVREMSDRKTYNQNAYDDEFNVPKDEYDAEEKILVMKKDRNKKIVKRYNGVEDAQSRVTSKYIDYPYLISIDEFSNDREDFDKVTIYYYENDDTLVDENEDAISDEFSVVGETLGVLEGMAELPDMLYVRNEKLEIDYEVIILNKSYKDTVVGVTESDDIEE